MNIIIDQGQKAPVLQDLLFFLSKKSLRLDFTMFTGVKKKANKK